MLYTWVHFTRPSEIGAKVIMSVIQATDTAGIAARHPNKDIKV